MCGIAGIHSNKPVAAELYDSLIHLQHRGQDAAGIITYKNRMHKSKGSGLVRDIFTDKKIARLKGNVGIAHNRYPTHGGFGHGEIQPFWTSVPYGIALAHNGNLTNAKKLKNDLVKSGAIFQTTSDTEAILHLVSRSDAESVVEKVIDALSSIQGAYALTIMTKRKLIGVRDPFGIRPLVLGDLDGSPILTSETCALDMVGAKYVRDVDQT